MDIEISPNMLASAVAIWGAVKLTLTKVNKYIAKISKLIQPIVEEIDKAGLDGMYSNAEKKAIAIMAVDILEKEGKIKLNFITRRVVRYIINKVASNLATQIKTTDAVKEASLSTPHGV